MRGYIVDSRGTVRRQFPKLKGKAAVKAAKRKRQALRRNTK